MRNIVLCLWAAVVSLGASTPAVSFATDFEDVLLQRHVFTPLGVVNGRYIDVGANHAFYASNTKLFHTMGWNGVVVDPSVTNVRTHWADRDGDVVLHSAATATTMDTIDLYSTGQLASVEPGKTDRRTGTVMTSTLGDICAKFFSNVVDLVSIDVERHELTVLKSVNLTLCRPKAVIIEVLANKQDIERHMTSEGYKAFLSIGFNTIYIPQESPLADTTLTPSQILAVKSTQHIATLLRDAASQGLINDIREAKGEDIDYKLKDCWWDQHKILAVHQRHLKPECAPSLFNTVFMRDGPGYYTYTCGGGAKIMVVGNTQPVLGLKNCVPGDLGKYVEKVETVKVAGMDSQLFRFKDGGSVVYCNYTHPATVGYQFVDVSLRFGVADIGGGSSGGQVMHKEVHYPRATRPLDLRTILELTMGSIIAGIIALHLHRRGAGKMPTSPRCNPNGECHA